MKIFPITGLGLIFTLTACFFAAVARERYIPPDNGRQETVAQGSRGCTVPQGELSLKAANPLTVKARDFPLTFYYDPPDIQSSSEVLLISLLHPKQPAPLFFQEIPLHRGGMVEVSVTAPLEPHVPYRLVAGLPCAGQTNNLKHLQITVEYVPFPTAAGSLSPVAN